MKLNRANSVILKNNISGLAKVKRKPVHKSAKKLFLWSGLLSFWWAGFLRKRKNAYPAIAMLPTIWNLSQTTRQDRSAGSISSLTMPLPLRSQKQANAPCSVCAGYTVRPSDPLVPKSWRRLETRLSRCRKIGSSICKVSYFLRNYEIIAHVF